MLRALRPGLPRETKRLSYKLQDGALLEVTERFERVTTLAGRDPVTEVRERRRRVRVKHAHDGLADVSAIQSVVPAGNGGSVACPVLDLIDGLGQVYLNAKNGRPMRISD